MQDEEHDRTHLIMQGLPRGSGLATPLEEPYYPTSYSSMDCQPIDHAQYLHDMDSAMYCAADPHADQYNYAEEPVDLQYAPLGYVPMRDHMQYTLPHQVPFESTTVEPFEQKRSNVPYGYTPYDFLSADVAPDLHFLHSLPSTSAEEGPVEQKKARGKLPVGVKRVKKPSRSKLDRKISLTSPSKTTETHFRSCSPDEDAQHRSKHVTFRLQVRQEPVHARMCGLGEKDRRPIDPPPIVQCVQFDADGHPLRSPPRDSAFAVHATLWSEDGSQERNLILTNPGKRARAKADDNTNLDHAGKVSRVLMGSLVTSPIILNDEKGAPGSFHVFQDLSIRTEGVYRLKFTLFSLSMADCMTPGSSVAILDECMTSPFIVYPAKKFPGMLTSTELTKAFAKQGYKIPVRTEYRGVKRQREDAESEAAQGSGGS